eukprot:gnl/TRDRNA2_/TRDRNA2_171894_c1_seq1.p1 gnl/TRDRNA2_/TRDRNA2_171894_c1~~gnl/TRDRNA2_/TRDRNA2_171894_c1_seq1.p1  ORF type:complete len:908 (+),score=145.03 gnl/TRDRNA2_/TRDRNA2_171894_c1_seq1:150-2873(+)
MNAAPLECVGSALQSPAAGNVKAVSPWVVSSENVSDSLPKVLSARMTDGWLTATAHRKRPRPRRLGPHCMTHLNTQGRDRLGAYGGSLATCWGDSGMEARRSSSCGQLSRDTASARRGLQSSVLQELAERRLMAKKRAMCGDPYELAQLLSRGAVAELQLRLGERNRAQTALGLRLLEAPEASSCINLLNMGADPLQRDANGNVSLHHARSEEHVLALLEAQPSAANLRNWAGHTPLEEILLAAARGCAVKGLLGVLRAFHAYCGSAPFFHAHSRTPWGHMHSADRASLGIELHWDDVREALMDCQDVPRLLGRIRELRTRVLPQKLSAAAEGAMRFLLLEEPATSVDRQQRLSELWSAVAALLKAGCGCGHGISATEQAACLADAEWLLRASSGETGAVPSTSFPAAFLSKNANSDPLEPDGAKYPSADDPRDSYRVDYAFHIVELIRHTEGAVESLYSNLLDDQHTSWLCAELPVDATAQAHFAHGLQAPPCAASWLENRDLDAAMQDLASFGGEPVTVTEVVEEAMFGRSSRPESDVVGRAFEFLDATRRRRIFDAVRLEVESTLAAALEAQGLVSMECSCVESGTRLPSAEPGDCLAVTTAVYGDAISLRIAYEQCLALQWDENAAVLTRTANGFHRDAPISPGGCRCLTFWLAMRTHAGTPVVLMRVELHLESLKRCQAASLLLHRIAAGELEPYRLRKPWENLLSALRELLTASARKRATLLASALTEVRLAIAEFAAASPVWLGDYEKQLVDLRSEEKILLESSLRLQERLRRARDSHELGTSLLLGKRVPRCLSRDMSELQERLRDGLGQAVQAGTLQDLLTEAVRPQQETAPIPPQVPAAVAGVAAPAAPIPERWLAERLRAIDGVVGEDGLIAVTSLAKERICHFEELYAQLQVGTA